MTNAFPPAQNDSADRPRRRATRPSATPSAPAGQAPAGHGPAAPSAEGGSEGSRRRRGGRGRGAGPRPEGQPADTRTPQDRETRAAEAVPVAPVVPAGDVATVLPTDTTFAELGVPAPLVEVLTASGITAPFPIQVATLPDTLAGRDVLGRGRTGSGKTLAFSIPLVARLAGSTSKRQPKRPRSLILVPTRELANQVAAVVDPLARALGMKTTVVFGGVGQNPQVQALAAGVDVLIACPGRLEDLINQRHADLGAVEITILDEADHMADLGFLPGVKRLLDRTPKVGQRLLFSATLDNGVDVLIKRYLSSPTTHSVDPAVAPVSTMTHHVFRVDAADKGQIVQELASGLGRTVMFTRTKHQAKKLAKQLTAAGVPAVDLHGNLSQNARERNLEAFSNGETRVLCATDIAARGIHVDDVAIVVHVDPPAEHKAYLHRSGRTARAGAGGIVVTIATPDQAGEVRTLARQAGITPDVSAIKPGAREITALTGPAAPYVEPAPVAAPQPQGTGGGGNGGRRRRSGGAGGAAPASSSGGGRGGQTRSAGPARTRAELAARAGQAPSGAGRGRGRTGR
ncbi:MULTISPECIES: DEAD/DEAH box helicase [unclassified Modestobacter]|uniref:DEAD/DEAH box helicase n=1 Tax=unclassified Modestobacter TaxID=2643866 RepID=UPI0022AA6BF1|nr:MULTISPECIES: DEAD/DEAH box helicase [unclassified Modestobacter]MCZ2826758.1 DEAD/DEAH box helicase [Modestobacter sp. VKM Ac-2981]MCZ2855138.1 DEAD/DEAH box helicase [Modestobacter sp. VKM Ac-2982]